ncbi:unnamed protein product [Amaranthus hypochondriacus]
MELLSAIVFRHLVWPIEWDPSSTIKSSVVSPRSANDFIKRSTEWFPLGRSFAKEPSVEKESRRPAGTSYLGFPAKTTTSLAANARTSAHETTPGHCFSISTFAASKASIPLKDMLFAG